MKPETTELLTSLIFADLGLDDKNQAGIFEYLIVYMFFSDDYLDQACAIC